MGSYGESDLARAVAVVAAGTSPSQLAGRLGIDWDYLSWIGLGVAEELIEDPLLQPRGAEAFTAGFLIGLHLSEPHGDLGRKLSFAVDSVQERGRHAVIADRCDLASVTSFETAYAEVLLESLELPPEIAVPVTQLFESGFATGIELGTLA